MARRTGQPENGESKVASRFCEFLAEELVPELSFFRYVSSRYRLR